MMGILAHTKVRTIRMLAAATLGVSLGVSGAASATTLQDMFDHTENFDTPNDGKFTQDGLTFSEFTPVLSTSLPSGSQLALAAATDPQSLLNIQFLDLSGAGTFSQGWGNAQAATAGNIDLDILADDNTTLGIDPGFRLNGNGEWSVDATNNVASAQLSAFAYTVTTNAQPINSADLTQSSVIDALGPDVFSLVSLPDVAGGFVLQFVLDPGSTDLSTALLNATVHGEINQISLIEQLQDWTAIPDTGALRVVNVIGLGASSGGGFTMETVEQRIDPPPPGTAGIPEPATLALMGMGLAGIGAWRRRRSDWAAVSPR